MTDTINNAVLFIYHKPAYNRAQSANVNVLIAKTPKLALDETPPFVLDGLDPLLVPEGRPKPGPPLPGKEECTG